MDTTEIIEQVTSEVRLFTEETVEPIKKALASLEERDTAPNDEKVGDLEKRLTDANERFDSLSEEVRLIQAGQQTAASPKSSDPFKGFVFKDIDAVRNELLHGNTRAVDLSSISAGGKLTDETASAFLDYVIGDQPTLSVIEKRMMNSPTARLDRIGVGERKLVLAVENNAPSDTDAITFTARSLAVVEAIWAENISLSFLEDNVTGQNAESKIAEVVAKAIGEELNDLAWTGDGASAPFRSINEGFRELITNDVDVTDHDMNSPVDHTTAIAALKALYSAMPSEYRTISDQRIFASPGFATTYMNELGGRATMLGDQTLVGGSAGLAYFGVPITVDRHLDADEIFMTPASNLVFGVHRDVTQELEWRPRTRQIELTVSLRFDYQHKYGKVIVRGHGLNALLQ